MIQAKVIQRWQKLSHRERKEIRRRSMRASDAVMRCRCKIILSLVQGKAPTMIAQGGLCAKSQVYRVADRFIEHGLVGLADRREDNGENKVTDAYGMELLRLIEGSPQEHGYRRPTWTQELLVLVLAERTGIRVSVTTMCRLLRQLGVRLNRPKPTVNCPWPRSRRTRRLRAIQRLVDNLASGRGRSVPRRSRHSPQSQDWARLDAGRKAEVRPHSGMQREALPRRRSQSPNRQAHMGRRRPEEQPLVPGAPLQARDEDVPERSSGPSSFSTTTASMTANRSNWP